MSDLLETLKLGTDHVKLINFPGTDKKVAIRILSTHDLQMATFATERLFKSEKIEVNMVSAAEYDAEKAIQILYLALKDPQNLDQSICKNVTEFRKALTKNERDILIDEYITFEKDCSSSLDMLSNEEFDRLVAEVKKKPETIQTNSLSTATLKRLITTLASQPVTLPADNG